MPGMATILVTGGAGYIGSHTVLALQAAGFTVAVLDNLSSGHREALPADARFFEQDLNDAPGVRRVLDEVRPTAVIHFAAFIEAGESMTDPRRFYHNNVINGISLLDELAERKIPVVFSSSAGVYGQPGVNPIPEDTPKNPVNVYGETKLVIEHVMEAYHRAYGLNFVALRYFNAAGAHPGGHIGEAHKTKSHLIELALLTALGLRESIKVFGADYDTRDGTCIRDYVHVDDLASAHALALQALLDGKLQARAFNVGLGQGFTVKEVLDAVDAVTGKTIRRDAAPRRAGDPAELVADSARIGHELGWTPRYTSLNEIVASAWAWHQSHPHDY